MTEPISLTLPELAARWHLSQRQVLERALQHAMPLYFYFDGLVFDFGDKWQRAGGDAEAVRQLAAHRERLETVQLDLQRQARFRAGWLKLSPWEHPFDDAETARHEADAQRLQHDIDELGKRLAERDAARQRSIRNGLLRAAPKTIKALAEHGQVAFPAYAYLLLSAADAANGKATVVALEDGFPLRTVLATDELCAAMQDVKQWDSAM
jgi:hypothetical protein